MPPINDSINNPYLVLNDLSDLIDFDLDNFVQDTGTQLLALIASHSN